MTIDEQNRDRALLTGGLGFLSKSLAEHLLSHASLAELVILIPESSRAATDWAASHGERVRLLVGNASSIDLGLSGDEYRSLVESVTLIHHSASHFRSKGDTFLRETERTLELAAECHSLRLFCHWSSTAVSGKRKGVVLESELDHHAGFYNPEEDGYFRAETLVRAARDKLPTIIFRPSAIIGDSRSGEIDSLGGLYYLLAHIVNAAHPIKLPLPGRGNAPMHVVPIDFVVRAAHHIAGDPNSLGRCFHLVDANPYSGRQLFELVANAAGTKLTRGYLPSHVARAILRAPGVDKLTKGAPIDVFDSFELMVFYNRSNTDDAIANCAIRCPPFHSYVERLVSFIRQSLAKD